MRHKDFFSIFQTNKLALWGLIILITILWGYAWVHMKASLDYMGPFTFTAFRFSVGALTLIIVMWVMKLGLPPKGYWKHLILVGLLQTSAVFLLVMYGLRFVEAGKSSVLLYSMPMWSSLLAVKYLGEKLTYKQLVGLFIGMIGLLTVLGWDIWIGQSKEAIFGELLIIIAAVVWAIANIYYRLHLGQLPKIQASAYQMTFGAVGIIIAAFLMEWGEPVHLNATSIYYILFTGIIASALCFTVWYFILSQIDMATATIATLLVPIFGLLFSQLLLQEHITIGVIVGASLIIVGIIFAQKTKRELLKER